MGPQRGRKVFTLQTIPLKPDLSTGSERVAKLAGFSLHAGVAAKAHQRDKLERLCRYISITTRLANIALNLIHCRTS